VLAYLGRYTHRVPIAISRLIAMTDHSVSFLWKDYRQEGGRKVMTLEPAEFMRRFLLHVLPSGFHRIRHFGFLANSHRAARLALCRQLLPNPPRVGRASATPTQGSWRLARRGLRRQHGTCSEREADRQVDRKAEVRGVFGQPNTQRSIKKCIAA
jgi:hypothetical protein